MSNDLARAAPLMREMPAISSVSYGSGGNAADFLTQYSRDADEVFKAHADWVGGKAKATKKYDVQQIIEKTEGKAMAEDTKRLVRVLIVDPDSAVPAEDALLYDSKEQFTDKTDQELYFEAPIQELLKEHNAKRVQIINKDMKERTEFLEEARIRDLNMVVVTVAEFS